MTLKSLIFTDNKQQVIRIQRFLVSMIAYSSLQSELALLNVS